MRSGDYGGAIEIDWLVYIHGYIMRSGHHDGAIEIHWLVYVFP